MTFPLPDWASPFADGTCGPDLEYDNAFLDLAQAAKGKPETQFEPAQVPDWERVEQGALALLERTRDLRLVILLTEARLNLQGLIALPEGLLALVELVRKAWPTVNPPLDGGDAYPRINAIESMGQGGSFYASLRKARVVRNPKIGELALRDFEPVNREQLEPFLLSPDCDLLALHALASQSQQAFDDLLEVLGSTLGAGAAPQLSEVQNQLIQFKAALPVPQSIKACAPPDAAPATSLLAGVAQPQPVRSRAQAVAAIEQVCAYLDQAEPGNPAQLLLRRARQLIDKNFLELVQELAPDSLRDVSRIMGVDPDSLNRRE